MDTVLDLSQLLADAPRNCWLSLDESQTKIIGRGETLEEAIAEAKRAGVDDPIVMWSPKKWMPSVF